MSFSGLSGSFRFAWAVASLLAMGAAAALICALVFPSPDPLSEHRSVRDKDRSPVGEPSSVPDAATRMLRKYKPAPLTEPLQSLLANPNEFYVPTMDHELIGNPAPDFALRDWRGHSVRLSDALRKGPVVLIFYYGYWCDHCVVQLFDLNEEIDKFEEVGATLMAISADPPEETARKFEQYGPFRFTVLSDPGNKVAEQYDCFDPASNDREARQFHGTFVVDSTGVIRWADISETPFRSIRTLLYEVARIQGRSPNP